MLIVKALQSTHSNVKYEVQNIAYHMIHKTATTKRIFKKTCLYFLLFFLLQKKLEEFRGQWGINNSYLEKRKERNGRRFLSFSPGSYHSA